MSKIPNDINWKRYMKVLQGNLDNTRNTGFRIYDQRIVTYKQNKLDLSAYYDQRFVLGDGIHTRPLKF